MGKNNRQRRAAKARGRRERTGQGAFGGSGGGPGFDGYAGFGSGFDGHPGFDGYPGFGGPGPRAAGATGHRMPTRDVLQLVLRHGAYGGAWRPGLQEFLTHPEQRQQQAIDVELEAAVERCLDGGWTPFDLHEVLRRKLSRPVVGLFLQAVAAATGKAAAATVHPRWREQLAALGTTADQPSTRSWVTARQQAWPDAVEELVELLVVVGSMPVLAPVLPRPGSATRWMDAVPDGIDERVLRRVRALLAKAEATEFEEEADALTAKAQELMTQYSIERTLLEATAPQRTRPVLRRVWLDNPYLVPKAMLVTAVADANHCRSVLTEQWGFLSLVGFERDLDVVDLLSTSLLVQATRAMTLAGRQVARDGTSRTRSFRQSFLVAYAGRIGERLRGSAGATETAADSAHGGTLLPVLASRQRAVDDTVGEMFPQTRATSVNVSNSAGWYAGRAAADLAQFDIRDKIGERTGTE